jgi:hypothetical protein
MGQRTRRRDHRAIVVVVLNRSCERCCDVLRGRSVPVRLRCRRSKRRLESALGAGCQRSGAAASARWWRCRPCGRRGAARSGSARGRRGSGWCRARCRGTRRRCGSSGRCPWRGPTWLAPALRGGRRRTRRRRWRLRWWRWTFAQSFELVRGAALGHRLADADEIPALAALHPHGAASYLLVGDLVLGLTGGAEELHAILTGRPERGTG